MMKKQRWGKRGVGWSCIQSDQPFNNLSWVIHTAERRNIIAANRKMGFSRETMTVQSPGRQRERDVFIPWIFMVMESTWSGLEPYEHIWGGQSESVHGWKTSINKHSQACRSAAVFWTHTVSLHLFQGLVKGSRCSTSISNSLYTSLSLRGTVHNVLSAAI